MLSAVALCKSYWRRRTQETIRCSTKYFYSVRIQAEFLIYANVRFLQWFYQGPYSEYIMLSDNFNSFCSSRSKRYGGKQACHSISSSQKCPSRFNVIFIYTKKFWFFSEIRTASVQKNWSWSFRSSAYKKGAQIQCISVRVLLSGHQW